MLITEGDLSGSSFVPAPADLIDAQAKAYKSFDMAHSEGYSQWMVMFSGGKDSTATAILASEWVKDHPSHNVTLTFVYSLTLRGDVTSFLWASRGDVSHRLTQRAIV